MLRKTLVRIVLSILMLLVVGTGVFVLLPSPIDAISWTPPSPAPSLTQNDALRNAELLGVTELTRPEDVTFDAEGRMYSGQQGGRIVRVTFDANGNPTYDTYADTQGNPLDLRFAPNGDLIVSDWVRGLIAITPDGEINTLVPPETIIEGVPFRRPDGIAIASDGTIYYGDGSYKDGEYNSFYEVIEGRSWGRLLAYDPQTQTSHVLIPELYFANGVALAPDESFVLVADQYRYRIARYWLTGDQAGTWDYWVENLPGLPHNIHYDENGVLWVALNRGRVAILDTLHPYPFLKNQLAKLPASLFIATTPLPETARGQGIVIALDSDGSILHNLQNPPASLNTLSAAYPHDGQLYMVSLDGAGFLRYPLPTTR